MRKYTRLRNLREDADMTHFEAGTRSVPIEILILLADLYKVNLDYLVERTDKKDMLPGK